MNEQDKEEVRIGPSLSTNEGKGEEELLSSPLSHEIWIIIQNPFFLLPLPSSASASIFLFFLLFPSFPSVSHYSLFSVVSGLLRSEESEGIVPSFVKGGEKEKEKKHWKL
jgi:hypothetical protein